MQLIVQRILKISWVCGQFSHVYLMFKIVFLQIIKISKQDASNRSALLHQRPHQQPDPLVSFPILDHQHSFRIYLFSITPTAFFFFFILSCPHLGWKLPASLEATPASRTPEEPQLDQNTLWVLGF